MPKSENTGTGGIGRRGRVSPPVGLEESVGPPGGGRGGMFEGVSTLVAVGREGPGPDPLEAIARDLGNRVLARAP